MKIKILIYIVLLSQLCIAQQTYKITEGELQFINPEKGIFIKKNDLISLLSDKSNKKRSQKIDFFK